MVKSAFQNIDVNLWVHARKLGVMQPSLCIFHDDRATGVQILEALGELEGDVRPGQRIITFRSCARQFALRTLKMQLNNSREELKVMHICHDRDTATIAMSDVGLSLLKDAVATWLDGGEDFGVSPRHSTLNQKEFGALDRVSGELWFWGPGYAGP